MSRAVYDKPEPPPSHETLARVAWTMSLVRELAATPAAGARRVRRLLVALREHHRAAAAAARIEVADLAKPADVGVVGWSQAAELARARHRIGVRAGDFLVDVVPLDAGRTARLELFRADPVPFGEADAAWLAVAHAGCAWAYGGVTGVRPADAHRAETLSPRDRETLEHLLAGASEKEIAARLRRSPHTVHTRVKRIYRRLGVSSRPELLARCLGGH